MKEWMESGKKKLRVFERESTRARVKEGGGGVGGGGERVREGEKERARERRVCDSVTETHRQHDKQYQHDLVIAYHTILRPTFECVCVCVCACVCVCVLMIR